MTTAARVQHFCGSGEKVLSSNPENVAAARERWRAREAAIRLVLPDLERLARSNEGVRLLLEGYTAASAAEACYRELFGAVRNRLERGPSIAGPSFSEALDAGLEIAEREMAS